MPQIGPFDLPEIDDEGWEFDLLTTTNGDISIHQGIPGTDFKLWVAGVDVCQVAPEENKEALQEYCSKVHLKVKRDFDALALQKAIAALQAHKEKRQAERLVAKSTAKAL